MYPEIWEDKKIMSSYKWPIICPIYLGNLCNDKLLWWKWSDLNNFHQRTRLEEEVHKIPAGGWWVSSVRMTYVCIPL